MREIRFRGRDLENGQPWRYGSLIQYPTGECAIVVTDSDVKELSYEVDPDTVGQDTGLKDINGTDIYEGDILEAFDAATCSRAPVKVIWDTEAPRFEAEDGREYCYLLQNYYIIKYGSSVIGNIHDNPKLMKGGSKRNKS